MLKIIKIQKGSPAEKAKIVPSDIIMNINGHEINDLLDFNFYTAEEPLKITFKDGNTSEEPNPTHEYKKPGTYNAVLIVVDDNGATNRIFANHL